MKIIQKVIDNIIDHARGQVPKECCGIIAAKDNIAIKVYRITNTAPDPLYAYEMGLVEYWEAMNDIADHKLNIGAIYHSHPYAEAYPSAADISRAYHGFIIPYIIISLREDEPVVRVFSIDRHLLSAEELELVPA